MDTPTAYSFHKEASRKRPMDIPRDDRFWPDHWRHPVFKEYPRLEKYTLPQVDRELGGLKENLYARESKRAFSSTPLTIEEVSHLLGCSAGLQEAPRTHRRTYPSGGGLYPVETYIAVTSVTGIEPGLYHYNVTHHTLEQMGDESHVTELKSGISAAWALEAPLLVVLTAQWERNFTKYGDFGYRMVLLEAGHITQNLQLVATGLKLNNFSFVDFDEDVVEKALDIHIQNTQETPLYMTAVGK